MAPVSLRHISKDFGPLTVLQDINVEIADGEFVVLVGPSGCGKSTTLRILAGLEAASQGQVLIGDRDVTELGPGQRDCAMVFQNYALYPHMTVAENIGFGMRLRRNSKAEIAQASAPVAEMLGLSALMRRYPRELSGGQRQRVAIGRAIIRHPEVFLFDEPLSNLDAKLRTDMRTEIKALHARVGKTTVYVTHDQVEAMTMANRIVVMDRGVIAQIGTPLAIYHHPVNRFVAGFFGSPGMNFIEGKLEGDGFTFPTGETLALKRVPEGVSGPRAVLGIRPEHCSFGDENGLMMTVKTVEPLCIHTIVVAEYAGQEFKLIAPGDALREPGATARVSIDPQLVHIFPADDGRPSGADAESSIH